MKLYEATHTAIIEGKEFKARKSGNRFFYYGTRAMRWMPVSKKNIVDAD